MVKFKEFFKKSTVYPRKALYKNKEIIEVDKFPISNGDILTSSRVIPKFITDNTKVIEKKTIMIHKIIDTILSILIEMFIIVFPSFSLFL